MFHWIWVTHRGTCSDHQFYIQKFPKVRNAINKWSTHSKKSFPGILQLSISFEGKISTSKNMGDSSIQAWHVLHSQQLLPPPPKKEGWGEEKESSTNSNYDNI